VAGDGDFLMCAQELATAVQHGLEVVVLVVDNGMYGTIRMHQERTYPGRVIATDLQNPDFAALAEAYGAAGETVADTGELPAALDRALTAGRPAVVVLKVDPEAIAPGLRLAALRRR
jgi:acetolactate synthase I/II/III large subunit